jgi:hypothetical protein
MELFRYQLSSKIWGYQIAIPFATTCPPASPGSFELSSGYLACRLSTPHLPSLTWAEHTFQCPPFHVLMVRRHISDDSKEMALSMSLQGISDSKIRELTGISERSLKRLRSTHRKTGVFSPTLADPGRPRILTAMTVKVRHTPLEYVLQCFIPFYCSSFVIALRASPTWHSQSCKQSSVKFVASRRRCKQSSGPSNGRAIL